MLGLSVPVSPQDTGGHRRTQEDTGGLAVPGSEQQTGPLHSVPESPGWELPGHTAPQPLSPCCFCSREVLGVEALWPILLAANAVPALAQLLTLPFFPDSPRYLLIDQKDKEGCIKGKEMDHKAFISAPNEPRKKGTDGKKTLGILALKTPSAQMKVSLFSMDISGLLALVFPLPSARVLQGRWSHTACISSNADSALDSQSTDTVPSLCEKERLCTVMPCL